jgi:CubicO group peptidase (beta-lactamase class C family)
MSTGTRRAVNGVLEQAVEAGAVPSVSALAADRDGIFYEGAAGPRVAGRSEPVTLDTHYRLMSMTKMVVTAVALRLIERGRLNLDDPVERYCPEFGDVHVLVGFDGDSPRLRPCATQVTVRQLLTHTSGLAYRFWNADLARWQDATGAPPLRLCLERNFQTPLVAQPGTKFEYGISADWLGRMIEAASGLGLDEVVKETVTGPLGMDQTGFRMSEFQRANSAPVHLTSKDGHWVASDLDLAQEPEYWSGGHGLYSTPRDYMRFQRALLGNGTSPDGVKILESETVTAAFTNQIGDLDFPEVLVTADPASSETFTVGPGYKWGYGLLLNTEDVPGGRRAGSGAWAGLFNTHFWVDRETGITAAIYSQFLPFVTEPAVALYREFEAALYASL